MERWGESLAGEIAPFGLGVTILVTGTYDTDIITDAGTTDDRDFEGPYARLHQTMNSRGRFAMQIRPATGTVRRRAGEGAGRPRSLSPSRRRTGRVDVVGVQQNSAAGGDASHVAARAGHSQTRRDARRRMRR